MSMIVTSGTQVEIKPLDAKSIAAAVATFPPLRMAHQVFAHDMLRWQASLDAGLKHRCYEVSATQGDRLVGLLPLSYVESRLFGRFLVSLPYINSAGVWAESAETATKLVDAAVDLADTLNVKYLELRQEREIEHPKLTEKNTGKALLRLALPTTADELWKSFKSKLRSQIRNGERNDFDIRWGGTELLGEFYNVFSYNMRDLGTPVFPLKLFRSILQAFGEQAELCSVRLNGQPVAVAMLIHGDNGTEVPSASSLRPFNHTNANMVMYWNLIQRAIERGQPCFDFGRSTLDSNTFRFKQQWGAVPHESIWQYYVRQGTFTAMRPDSARYQLAIRMWRKLPVKMTQWLGPIVVRGIP